MIKEKEGGQFGNKYVYRIPTYSTDYLGDSGHSSAVVKIKDVFSNSAIHEIFTLEEFGKIIVWNLAELTKYELQQGLYDLGMGVDAKIKLIKTTEFSMDEYYFSEMKQSALCSDLDMDKLASKYSSSLK